MPAAPTGANQVVPLFDFRTGSQDAEGDFTALVVVSLDDPLFGKVHIATTRYWLKFIHAT
jgi:hypothetical protein